MKKVATGFLVSACLVLMTSCHTHSKKSTWSKEQEENWKQDCITLYIGKGNSKGEVEDFCDCMFDKTAAKYTPEEAKQITVEEERKIYEDCDYAW